MSRLFKFEFKLFLILSDYLYSGSIQNIIQSTTTTIINLGQTLKNKCIQVFSNISIQDLVFQLFL